MYKTIASMLAVIALAACNHGNENTTTTPSNGTDNNNGTNQGTGSSGASNSSGGDLEGTGGNNGTNGNGAPGSSDGSSMQTGPTSLNSFGKSAADGNLIATSAGGVGGRSGFGPGSGKPISARP